MFGFRSCVGGLLEDCNTQVGTIERQTRLTVNWDNGGRGDLAASYSGGTRKQPDGQSLPEAERLATVMLNPKPASPRMWANFRRKARRVANVAMLTPS